MHKKMLFVFNPKAGKAQIKNKLLEIIDIFTKAGYRVTAYPTQNYLDATTVVQESVSDYDTLVCCGGDGTLDEVVTGLMKSRINIPIGYIPAGSTNDFANSLNLSKNMITAAHTIVEGEKFACDIGTFNNDYFVYIAAFGLFTDVSYLTKQEMKNILGHMAYLLEGVKSLFSIKSYHIKVECNEEVVEDDFMFGMVSNSLSAGGFKNVTGKNVELNDGLFEVIMIKRPGNPLELQEIISSLLNNDMEAKYVYSCKTDKIRITSDVSIPWTLDGEYGGEQTEVKICNNRHAIEIFVQNKDSDNE